MWGDNQQLDRRDPRFNEEFYSPRPDDQGDTSQTQFVSIPPLPARDQHRGIPQSRRLAGSHRLESECFGRNHSRPWKTACTSTTRSPRNRSSHSNGPTKATISTMAGLMTAASNRGGGSLDAWSVFFGNKQQQRIRQLTDAATLPATGLSSYSDDSSAIANTSGVSPGYHRFPGRPTASTKPARGSSQPIALQIPIIFAQIKIEYYSQFGGTYGSVNFLAEIQTTIADTR